MENHQAFRIQSSHVPPGSLSERQAGTSYRRNTGRAELWQRLALFAIASLALPASPANWLSPAAAAPVLQQQERKTDEDLVRRIDELLGQLRSESFSQRQLAAEQLWELGPDAAAILEKRLGVVEPEIAGRIDTMLTSFRLGIDASTPRSMALLILYFHNGDIQVRDQISRVLYRQQRLTLLLDLIATLETHNERLQLYDNTIDLEGTISRLASQNHWDQIEALIEHPLCLEFDMPLIAFHARISGTFDELLSRQIETVDRSNLQYGLPDDQVQENEDENIGGIDGEDEEQLDREPEEDEEFNQWQRNLQQLISMMRIGGKFEEATRYAKFIVEPEERAAKIQQLHVDAGRWDLVCQRLEIRDEFGGREKTRGEKDATGKNEDEEDGNGQDQPDDDMAVEPKVVVTPYQKAVAHLFAGDEPTYRKIVDDMIGHLRESKTNKEIEQTRNLSPGALFSLLIANLDLETAAPLFDEFEFDQKYELYSWLQQFDKAFDAMKLKEDADQRIEWFEGNKVRQINSILSQHERNPKGRYLDRADLVFQTCVQVASQLGLQGYRDEALLHLSTLMNGVDNSNSLARRNLILQVFVSLGAYEQAWQMLEQRYRASDRNLAIEALFGEHFGHADYWFRQLEPHCKDQLTRLRLIARMLNSPLKVERAPIDLDQLEELFADATSWTEANQDQFYYRLASLRLMHGQPDRYAAGLKQTLRSNLSEPVVEYAQIQWMNGDYLQAASTLDQRSRINQSALISAWAGEAYSRAGEEKKAVFRKTAMFAIWLNNYRKKRIADEFVDAGRELWLREALNVSIYAKIDRDPSVYREILATMLWDVDPEEAERHWNVVLFNHYIEGDAILDLSLPGKARFRALANGLKLVKQGDTQSARSQFQRCLKFRPGDAELGEKVIPELDRAGETALADELFHELTGYYVDVLSRYPDSPTHHNNYAWICACSGRRNDFVRFHAELAVELQPDTPAYLDTLATALFVTGDAEKAAETSARCLQLNTGSTHYMQQLYKFGGQIRTPEIRTANPSER